MRACTDRAEVVVRTGSPAYAHDDLYAGPSFAQAIEEFNVTGLRNGAIVRDAPVAGIVCPPGNAVARFSG
ncbi:hypothetical protein [Lysobacter sp. Root690]|uniref:hypothetical protein n=1 Tax=Lysobacter sp. Root690 TaxID=1736588 RepID=UPI0006F325FD|nr:hypothetical protein [Lysobacter sp. Root690]KRB07927.1 hypothetical protein ASD86_08960 [Lysobacter sp. Root690]